MVNRQTPEFLNWFKRNYTLPDFSKLPCVVQDRIYKRYESEVISKRKYRKKELDEL